MIARWKVMAMYDYLGYDSIWWNKPYPPPKKKKKINIYNNAFIMILFCGIVSTILQTHLLLRYFIGTERIVANHIK